MRFRPATDDAHVGVGFEPRVDDADSQAGCVDGARLTAAVVLFGVGLAAVSMVRAPASSAAASSGPAAPLPRLVERAERNSDLGGD